MNATLCACGCGQPTAIAKKTSIRDGTVRGHSNRYVHGHHIGRGADAITWKGGRSLMKQGYVRVYRPEHPRATDGYVLEHILVVEAALGHLLDPKHQVHHVDHDRANNAPLNLVACEDQAYHQLLHRRERMLARRAS